MKMKLLVTGLVLGLSSMAFAAPSELPRERPRDDFYTHHHPMQEWTTLSSGRLLSGKQQIRVRSSDAFTKLKLEAAGRGSMVVDKIVITFGNGQKQVVDLDKRLTPRDPVLIDLDGNARRIRKIVVYGGNRNGRWSRGGTFNLLAV